jgi:osmotically-inducible protein OsmY
MSDSLECDAGGNGTLTSRSYWIAGLAFASGATLGALAMYLCDPARGKVRRLRLQQHSASKVKHLAQDIAGKTEDVLNRTKGAFARASSVFVCHNDNDDDIIAERVRSHIGHVTRHAHAVETNVAKGVVILTGTLAKGERQRVLAEVRGIPGVRAVDDKLTYETFV